MYRTILTLTPLLLEPSAAAAQTGRHGRARSTLRLYRAAKGAIPLFPGSRPLRCDNSGLSADFTFGAETSLDMRKAMQVIVHGDPSDPLAPHKAANAHLGADMIPATGTKLAEIERFLRSRGYIRMGTHRTGDDDRPPAGMSG